MEKTFEEKVRDLGGGPFWTDTILFSVYKAHGDEKIIGRFLEELKEAYKVEDYPKMRALMSDIGNDRLEEILDTNVKIVKNARMLIDVLDKVL